MRGREQNFYFQKCCKCNTFNFWGLNLDIIEQDKNFLFYTSIDGETNIQVLVEDETIWTTQAGMAEIFDIDKSGI